MKVIGNKVEYDGMLGIR